MKVSKPKRKKLFCKVHGNCAHSTEDCRNLKEKGKAKEKRRDKREKGKTKAHNVTEGETSGEPDNNESEDDDSVHIVRPDNVIVTQQRWPRIYLYLVSEPQQKGNAIIIDCRATTNMIPHAEWFDTLTFRRIHPPHPVRFGDNTTAEATGIGDVWISSKIGDKQYTICLKNTLLVPTFRISLVSVSKLGKAGYISTFDGDTGYVSRKRTTVMTARERKGLYHLQVQPLGSPAGAMLSMDINVLHRQMGHAGVHQLKRMVTKGQIKDVKTLTRVPEFCEPCVMGKMKKLPFKRSETVA